MPPDDNKQAEESQVEEQTPEQDVSPTSEEAKEPAQSQAQEEAQEPSEAESPEQMNDKQAKAFQEMRQEIKKLKSELTEKEQRESMLEQVAPKSVDQGQQTTQTQQRLVAEQGIDASQFYTETGEFDVQGYNKAVNQRMQQIESRQQQYQQEVEKREVMSAYPQLNPESESYDPGFDEAVAQKWLWERYQGNNPTFKEVADGISNRLTQNTEKAKKEGMKEATEKLSEKEQASLDASPQTPAARQQASSVDDEVLRSRIRQGDENALAEKLSKIGWKNK